MNSSDIVNQLAAEVPKYTDGFTASVGVVSIIPGGTTATVTTDAAHGRAVNDNVVINGALTPVEINTPSFSRVGTSATFQTLQDHDLTESDNLTITISGANESEFNGTFPVSGISNRRSVAITVTDSGPTTISGSPIVEDGGPADLFNGLQTITSVPSTTLFTYELPQSYTVAAAVDNAEVRTVYRIGAVLDIVQYLNDVYTKQTVDEDQLLVQLGDVTRSKSRTEQTDATDSNFGNNVYTPVFIQPFAVYIVQNVTDQLTAAAARDLVESTYFPAVLRAIERQTFATGLTYDYGAATCTGHGVFAYADENGKNKAIYVHEITFEQLARMTKDDTFDLNISVAMRGMDYALGLDIGTGVETMTAAIDLDEEPL